MSKPKGSNKSSGSYVAVAEGQTRRPATGKTEAGMRAGRNAGAIESLKTPELRKAGLKVLKDNGGTVQALQPVHLHTGEQISFIKPGADGKPGMNQSGIFYAQQNGPKSTTYNLVNSYYGKDSGGKGRRQDRETVVAENLTRGQALVTGQAMLRNAVAARPGGEIAFNQSDAQRMATLLLKEK